MLKSRPVCGETPNLDIELLSRSVTTSQPSLNPAVEEVLCSHIPLEDLNLAFLFILLFHVQFFHHASVVVLAFRSIGSLIFDLAALVID